ncbi:hypothetical protein C8Q72DRAFT_800670 [Fomitopsis betulina]|nr:hypothetical protein C8Q72DRAFT_800670 [Fomitopsis betulina]
MAKRNAIIFGGVNTCGRALAAYLVPPNGESLVENLRIVDKYSVSPPTTYIGAQFKEVLTQPNVTYRQANLTVASTVASCFDPPEGQEPYSYVFDLTGEVQWDRPEAVQINNTLRMARHVGLEAAKRGVTAYVRIMHPFYECKEKGTHDEKDDPKPDGIIGTWWHETMRTLGAIEGLNLVILRKALVYGPYIDNGPIISSMAMAAVYGYLKQPVKGLWSPGKHPSHTVHVDDVAAALWACAEWMASVGGRAKADELAGEEIPWHNDKSKLAEVSEVFPPDRKVVAPLFNVEDDSQLPYVEVATRIAKAFGTTFGFFNFMVNTLAKFNLEDVVEDINEGHVSTWTTMITESTPPVLNTPFTAYTDIYNLKKHVIAFKADKLKRLTGWQPKHPEFTEDEVREVVVKLKAEGTWPNNES